MLKRDSLFPARLHNDLEEVQAFMYYKQGMWDSTAVHLEKALSNAANRQEKARWEYLLGQLNENTRNLDAAADWYEKSIAHTTDPIMDVYARLAGVRVHKNDSIKDYIAENIATLTKMARRDKYSEYRDIIYYMAAQIELERNNSEGALELLSKGTKYITDKSNLRNRIFLQMAELSFTSGLFRQSANFYDSIQMGDPIITDPQALVARKSMSIRMAEFKETIVRQDSLQKLSTLDENERRDRVKKLVRILRRQQGLKDEGVAITTGSATASNQPPPSLFGESKGEWYFYNSNARQKGLNDFRTKWGTRKNTDNWRRSSAQMSAAVNMANNPALSANINAMDTATGANQITFDALYARIPMTPEKLQVSNDSIRNALFGMGITFIQELEDCARGTATLEELRTRFPDAPKMDEILFNLYFCYRKNGETVKADAARRTLSTQYGKSTFNTIVITGKDPNSKAPKPEVTKLYEGIYDLFIEGNFTEAVARKRTADSSYGSTYWTPQLLYIEAVYYVKQREDSVAKKVLQNIIAQFSANPLAKKAATLLDVLNRRAEIEEELRNMVIKMPVEDTTQRRDPIAVVPPPTTTLPPSIVKTDIKIQPSKDSLNIKNPAQGVPGLAQKPIRIPKDSIPPDTIAAKPDTAITTVVPKKDTTV
ncbi:MAG: hypothetical protein J7527_16715, partial [Chitinophagaceae bacterium]|nr:hypothetical protein [Chitinophagaceae bacterium]